jgi:hypothetical protein
MEGKIQIPGKRNIGWCSDSEREQSLSSFNELTELCDELWKQAEARKFPLLQVACNRRFHFILQSLIEADKKSPLASLGMTLGRSPYAAATVNHELDVKYHVDLADSTDILSMCLTLLSKDLMEKEGLLVLPGTPRYSIDPVSIRN